MATARIISLNKAIAIIIIASSILVAAGLAVGNKLYLNPYDQRPQVEKEQEVYKSQVRSNPKDLTAHLNLGWTYYQEGKKELALSEYNKALKLDRENIRTLYNLGLVQKDLKHYREAEQDLQKVLQKEPGHESAAFTLAQVYRESKQYDKAVLQYQQALKQAPASADIMAELGMAYEALGQKEQAVKQYRDALRFVPNLKDAQNGLKRLDT